MLKSKSAILIAVGVLLSIATGLQFIKKQEQEIPKTIKVIPADAAVIIQTKDLPLLMQKLNTSVFKNKFLSVTNWEDFFNNIEFVDSLLKAKREIRNAFSGNEFICSGHLAAKNKLDFLFVLSINEDNEDKIQAYIAELVSERAAIMQRSYEGYNVYDLAFFDEESKNKSFSYAFAKGYFIFSFSKILTEEAIRTLNSGVSLISDKAYSKLAQSAGKNVDANIFINYKYFSKNLKNLVNPKNSNFFQFADHFASWTVFDLKLKKTAILMSGLSYSDDSLNNYLNVFAGQDNVENDFLEVLPENTSAFFALNFNDNQTFKTNYINYLKKSRKYRRVQLKLDEFKKDYKLDLAKTFYENIEGAISISNVQQRPSEKEQQHLGFFQLKDEEDFALILDEINKQKPVADSIVITTQNSLIVIDNEKDIKIKKFPISQIFPLLYGKIFNPLEANFYIIVNDYLIVAKSTNLLKQYYKQIKQGLTLAKNKDFALFANSVSSESNIFLYANFYHSKSLFKTELTTKLSKIYNKNTDKFDELQAVSLQFGLENELFFTNIYLNYNPASKKETKSAWEVRLDTLVNMKPQIVKNHYTGNMEVLVQDAANNLILIGTNGKILWKRHLPGKILGKVHQIDFYKNNKLQLLFNTRKYIFLIDRNGKDVENYPIKFKSPATNGLLVLDYEGKKNYRIFVACENKNVYLLNKNAGKVAGWQFEKTLGTVRLPIQYFNYDGKDYLVFADNKKVYILNRRGQTRIELKSQFVKSKKSAFYFDKGISPENARFVTTNNTGVVYFIYMNGAVKKMTLDEFSSNHNFKYADLYGNGKKYFIFTDDTRLIVFNHDKSVRFEQKFDGALNNSLNLYSVVGKSKLIGVAVNSANKIYLLSPSGKTIKGFPMQGYGAYSISKLNIKATGLNLLVGGNDQFLYNYSIHQSK